jgi:hypothetical protein
MTPLETVLNIASSVDELVKHHRFGDKRDSLLVLNEETLDKLQSELSNAAEETLEEPTVEIEEEVK